VTERFEVLLISMPFSRLKYPPIALSLLRSVLASAGIPSTILYFGARFAKGVGVEVYDRITDFGAQGDLIGEWVFSRGLFGGEAPDGEGYVDSILRRYGDAFANEALRVRQHVDEFLNECAADVIRQQPAVVGFTSVFQQHVPSLALAKRIKSLAPRTFIVFGGANCESVMGAETIRQFPFVDAAVSGEGEVVLPDLVRRILRGESVDNMLGVYTRKSIATGRINGTYPNAPRVEQLDDLPMPDYDDFFADLPADSSSRELLFETSRGCWWGQKQHCTFCGLSDDILLFRSKSSRRVLDELDYLIRRYPVKLVHVVDNILDMRYFKDLIPELAARPRGVNFFYEVKANLRKDQLRLMRDAGITAIQPGIESFSTPILMQMRKGITGLRNIQVLKWCQELGIRPTWLLLWGFPQEPAAEYARMSELVPLITHLEPPDGGMPIRLERFSPNFEQAEAMGFANPVPSPAYRFIYPFQPEVVANLAYFFDYGYQKPQNPKHYTKDLKAGIAAWKKRHAKEFLILMDKKTHLEVIDTRAVALEREVRLSGLQRNVYLMCDEISTIADLQKHITADHAEIERTLHSLVERRLMIAENGAYLSLAINPFAKVPALREEPVGAVYDRAKGAHTASLQ